MPLRADRDLTWTHHAVLSFPLPDPWSRPCTGDIMHPQHGKHHGAAMPSLYIKTHFTNILPWACPRPAVLGLRVGKQQFVHDNLTFEDHRARSAHRARPYIPTTVVEDSSSESCHQLASRLSASSGCLLCATTSGHSLTGSPRGGTTSLPYMSGQYSVVLVGCLECSRSLHRWPIEPMGPGR